MFRSLIEELKSLKMDDSWVCSYCGLCAADDPNLSKFHCVECADEFVFCSECFFETHRKFFGKEDRDMRRCVDERRNTQVTELQRKKLEEDQTVDEEAEEGPN